MCVTLAELPTDLSLYLVELSLPKQCCPWSWCSLDPAVVASGALGVLVEESLEPSSI